MRSPDVDYWQFIVIHELNWQDLILGLQRMEGCPIHLLGWIIGHLQCQIYPNLRPFGSSLALGSVLTASRPNPRFFVKKVVTVFCFMSKWGIDPERDIWSLGVMVQGSGQMGELSARRRRRHLEIGVWNSFSFRAWIGLIWEISPRKPDHSAWNFGARLFCKNPKNQEKIIFPICPGYQENGKIKFPIFPGYEKLEKTRFPVFPGYEKIIKIKFASISRIELNWF